MSTREVRFTAEAGLSADAAAGEGQSGPVLRGYAAVFNSLSHDLAGFKEKILPGAFTDSIKKRDVLALFGHDSLSLLGRMRNGSLSLREDQRGLAFQLRLPRTQLGADIAALVGRSDLSQMSFGFAVPPGGDTWSREGTRIIRTLRKVDLFEISIVPEPAYEQTSVTLRVALDTVLAGALADRQRRLEALL